MLRRYSSLIAMLLIVGMAIVFVGHERNALPHREGHVLEVPALPPVHPRFQAFRRTALRPNRASSGAALVDEMAICGWFASKNPSPRERVKLFDEFARSNHCVINGWYGDLQSVQALEGGKRIQMSLSPSLVSLRGGVPFTTMNCIEEWLATAGGEMQIINVNLGDRPGFFMTD